MRKATFEEEAEWHQKEQRLSGDANGMFCLADLEQAASSTIVAVSLQEEHDTKADQTTHRPFPEWILSLHAGMQADSDTVAGRYPDDAG
jgi:hypothetical protein